MRWMGLADEPQGARHLSLQNQWCPSTKKPASGFPTRAWYFREIVVMKESVLLLLLRKPLAGSFVDAISAFVFFADFFDQSASYEILKFLISTEAKHFLTAADGVTELQVFEHAFEEVVETEHFVFSEHVAKFICDVVWKPA